jgi:hypothetical protein
MPDYELNAIRDLELQTERDPRSEKHKIPDFGNFPATYLSGAMVKALGSRRIRAPYGQSAVTKL